jgi:tetratricopeptide (TPR) repeat protein
MIGYFLAGEFVQYYVDAYSHETLVKALALIGDGMSAEEALATTAEQSLEAVDKGFEEYLDERCSDLANLPAPPSHEDDEAFTVLRSDQWPGGQAPFTVALKKGADAAKEEQWEEAEEALRQAHELYPEYNGADSPLRQLAAMFEYLKEEEKLAAVLLEIIDSQSSPFKEIEQLLAIYKKQDNWEEVQRVAALAFAIDPFNMAMERTRAEAMINTGEKKDAIQSLARLAHLDPTRAVEYRLQRAQLLHQTGRSGEAKAETIQLLEEMPHYWEAQKLLLAIVEEDPGAAR